MPMPRAVSTTSMPLMTMAFPARALRSRLMTLTARISRTLTTGITRVLQESPRTIQILYTSRCSSAMKAPRTLTAHGPHTRRFRRVRSPRAPAATVRAIGDIPPCPVGRIAIKHRDNPVIALVAVQHPQAADGRRPKQDVAMRKRLLGEHAHVQRIIVTLERRPPLPLRAVQGEMLPAVGLRVIPVLFRCARRPSWQIRC